MVCRLCEKDAPLRNSHIIPEFLYSSLYDEKHRFHVLSVEQDKRDKFLQKGIREKLLCHDCESQFSKYERYASLVLNGGFELIAQKEGRLTHFSGIEYESFKLFALSILWRASVSSIDMFDGVNLGHHQSIIRNMLLKEDPGDEHIYPFVLSPILHENKVQEDLIVKPTRSRLEGHIAYRFVFGGLIWVFIVSGHKLNNVVINASINRSGKLTMLSFELSDVKFISDLARDLSSRGGL